MMKIARLETFHNEFVWFVRVTTETGDVGWGQCSTYNADITATIFHRQVARWALGADALEIGRLLEHIEEREHKFPGSYRCRALGAGIAKLLDANSGFSPRRAIEVGRLLESEGIGHFEEPCPYWQLEQTKQVTDALALDVTGGEQDWDLATWARMIELRAVDIVQPDIMYMGGLVRTLRVAQMAAGAGLPCTPHSANLSLVTICTMHLLGAIPNAGQYLELSIEGPDYYPWQDGLFLGDPYRIAAGCVSIPAAPGWGVEINPQWLAGATYQCSEQAR